MKTSFFILLAIMRNISKQSDYLNQIDSLTKFLGTFSVGFVTILILLAMNLFKVNKQKKRIKFLEEQLNILK
jgi:hypothetical protein